MQKIPLIFRFKFGSDIPDCMYSTLQLVTNYFRFYASASNSKGHGMHSPFVYQFIREVLQDHTAYEDYRQWEKWRSSKELSTIFLRFCSYLREKIIKFDYKLLIIFNLILYSYYLVINII